MSLAVPPRHEVLAAKARLGKCQAGPVLPPSAGEVGAEATRFYPQPMPERGVEPGSSGRFLEADKVFPQACRIRLRFATAQAARRETPAHDSAAQRLG